MEIRAPYALLGVFVLAVIGAVFGFVYWLHNTAGLGERAVYRVRYENTVSGLLKGAAVLFNGIRVGEVTELQLDPKNPKQVMVTIAVVAATPVRSDTQAGLEFQGLTGVPVVTLQGGSADPAAWTTKPGEPPMLVADPFAGQSMTQAARDALRRVDTVLAENSEPLRSTIANLQTFSAALARNSDRVDAIVAGVERLTGGGGPAAATPVIYDLTAPRVVSTSGKAPSGQLIVAEPSAPISLDTRKILVRPAGKEDPSFTDAAWADNVPKLLQAKVIQSFENSGFLRTAAKSTEGFTADHQLLIDIRSFQVTTSPAPVGEVEFTAKILGDNGQIVDARIFRGTAPVKGTDAARAAAALNEAFGKAATELVLWTLGVI
jgi:phospholipid/cholesterol/gamma-HCH transport system substrate-binding protein